MLQKTETRPARLSYRIPDAVAASGIGRDGIYAAIRSGKLRARRYGRIILITPPDFEAFLASLPEVRFGEDEAA